MYDLAATMVRKLKDTGKMPKIIINQEKYMKMKCMFFSDPRFIQMLKCKQSKNKSIYYSP